MHILRVMKPPVNGSQGVLCIHTKYLHVLISTMYIYCCSTSPAQVQSSPHIPCGLARLGPFGPQVPWGLVGLSHFRPPGTLRTESSKRTRAGESLSPEEWYWFSGDLWTTVLVQGARFVQDLAVAFVYPRGGSRCVGQAFLRRTPSNAWLHPQRSELYQKGSDGAHHATW